MDDSVGTTRSELTVAEIVQLYLEGRREFRQLDFVNTLDFEGCNLDDVDFSKSFIDGTFENVSLRNPRFELTSIKTVDFKNCDLTFANFKKAGLEAATFEGCKISHACFDLASVYKTIEPDSVPPGMSRS